MPVFEILFFNQSNDIFGGNIQVQIFIQVFKSEAILGFEIEMKITKNANSS